MSRGENDMSFRISPLTIGLRVVSMAILIAIISSSCWPTKSLGGEILVGLKPDAVALLKNPDMLIPLDTGIPSLDALNRRWGVRKMVRVFPNVSPDDEVATRYGLANIYLLVVPVGTDLETMVREYRADPHVDYAEINTPYKLQR